ncbi:phosphoglycerate kinase [Candidatus Nanohalococcus occultus]|uniref:Phosphoglycerate kinase n=1 Tax=Candidatus Nanohalococcus occultus TaxID=2978047 RepID=A0ABY8CDF1_9ARCH|nr:3-phosphoglycerate kinase [Candidatus Nanohaloarchaeota archaeon SVXNc]
MRGLSDTELESKNILLRTDLNLPIEDGEPQKTVRFERYLETIEEISQKGGKTLIIAHQGRPSRSDFLSLEDHAKILSDELGRDVELVKSFFGSELGEAVASMQEGDVKLLENIRLLSEELQNLPAERHANDYFVKNAEKYFDIYVNDAFSAAHRSHASLVGFNSHLDDYAGLVMERELESCRKIRDELDSPTLVLGGEKPSDIIGMLEKMIEDVQKVLLGGVPGELALVIEGNSLGEKKQWLEQQGLDGSKDELETLLDEHGEKFVLPEDVRTADGNQEVGEVPEDAMIWDIGEKTEEKFAEKIRESNSVLMKGPMGAFEDHPSGTKTVVEAIAENKGFTVLGGGHTSSLVQRFDHDLEEFSHVSIAGGAFVRFMSGEKLAAVEALR